MSARILVALLAATVPLGVVAGCDGDGEAQVELVGEADRDRFPDVTDAVATYDEATGSWTFEVTISSPYDSPERYADGWRIVGEDGIVYATHTLTHDHADEQPFTRRQSGVSIPDDVGQVTVEGRDLVNGYGGRAVVVTLPSR